MAAQQSKARSITDDKIESGRLKIIRIGARELLNMFLIRGSQYPLSIDIPIIDDIPDGCEIVHREFNGSIGSYNIYIYHPSFEVVPHNEIPLNIIHRIDCITLYPHDGQAYKYDLVDALQKQIKSLRGLIDDFNLDSPPTKKSYEVGWDTALMTIKDTIEKEYQYQERSIVKSSLIELIEKAKINGTEK